MSAGCVPQALPPFVRTPPASLLPKQARSIERVPGGQLRVSYTDASGGAQMLPAAAVVLATGGFAASRQLLQAHCPTAASLATTNGPWATGDGLQLGACLGADTLHLDQVQVHPTGFVDPQAPDAPTKVWQRGAGVLGGGGGRGPGGVEAASSHTWRAGEGSARPCVLRLHGCTGCRSPPPQRLAAP